MIGRILVDNLHHHVYKNHESLVECSKWREINLHNLVTSPSASYQKYQNM